MDYSSDDCLNLFTRQQAKMMRITLKRLRPGLIQGQAPTTDTPVLEPMPLQILPNPSPGIFNLYLKDESLSIQEIKVYSGLGKKIKTLKQKEVSGDGKLNLSELGFGYHRLDISSSQGMIRKYVVIQK